MRINMRIKRMWICAMRMDMRINRMYNDPHRHIAILARHGLAVVGWQRDSMDHIQELRANLLAVIQLRQDERDMFQSNDRTVENSITNIQGVRRAISEKVRQLRHSNKAGDESPARDQSQRGRGSGIREETCKGRGTKDNQQLAAVVEQSVNVKCPLRWRQSLHIYPVL